MWTLKQNTHTHTHTHTHTQTYFQNRKRLLDIENKFMVTKGEGGGERNKVGGWD